MLRSLKIKALGCVAKDMTSISLAEQKPEVWGKRPPPKKKTEKKWVLLDLVLTAGNKLDSVWALPYIWVKDHLANDRSHYPCFNIDASAASDLSTCDLWNVSCHKTLSTKLVG